jgi:hypothetical protein
MNKPYFEPQELTVLTAVLQRACLDMGIGDSFRREDMAARIIRLAQSGEWDFDMPAKGRRFLTFSIFLNLCTPK